ncbi:hypothetical protein [Clostridium sp. UBA2485]|uniref:hypothetical protein n=1 Tax=Clostridium sp. UBA2485 TaxID=1946352 RepID=UPI0025B7CFCF|nr:hypothetical protein [Clostridium sp. UBA2485]
MKNKTLRSLNRVFDTEVTHKDIKILSEKTGSYSAELWTNTFETFLCGIKFRDDDEWRKVFNYCTGIINRYFGKMYAANLTKTFEDVM